MGKKQRCSCKYGEFLKWENSEEDIEMETWMTTCEKCGKTHLISKYKYKTVCKKCQDNVKNYVRWKHLQNKKKRLTIGDIKDLNRKAGQHWFSPDTMKFFKSKVPNDWEGLVGNRFFITSEKSPYDKRKYTIREWKGRTKSIDSVGDFNKLNTKAQAERVLKKLMEGKINF